MSKKFKFKSEKPKEKWKIFGCADLKTGTDLVSGAHLELFGNKEIIIEGCMGVLEYSDTYLKLKLPKGALLVCGCDFDIVCFAGTTITIRGKVSSLEFCI